MTSTSSATTATEKSLTLVIYSSSLRFFWYYLYFGWWSTGLDSYQRKFGKFSDEEYEDQFLKARDCDIL